MSTAHHRRRQLLQALLPDIVSRLEGIMIRCTRTSVCLSEFMREVRYAVAELALQLLRHGLLIIELDVRESDDGRVEILYDVASYDPAAPYPVDSLAHIVVSNTATAMCDPHGTCEYAMTSRVLFTFYSNDEDDSGTSAEPKKTALSEFLP